MKKFITITLIIISLLTVTSCKKQSTDINTVHVSESTVATDAEGNTVTENPSSDKSSDSNKDNNNKNDKANSDLTKTSGDNIITIDKLLINNTKTSSFDDQFKKDNSNAMVFEGDDFTNYTIYGKGYVAQKAENNDGSFTYQFSLYGSDVSGPLGIKIGDSSKNVLSKLSSDIDNSLKFDVPSESKLLYLTSSTDGGVTYTCAAVADNNSITATIKSSSDEITVKFKFSNDAVETIDITQEK